jgi:hypothetical protein
MSGVYLQALQLCTPRGCEASPALTMAEGTTQGPGMSPSRSLHLAKKMFPVLASGKGPVWGRQLALGPEGKVCPEVEQVRKTAGHVATKVAEHVAHSRGRPQLFRENCQGWRVLQHTLLQNTYSITQHYVYSCMLFYLFLLKCKKAQVPPTVY